MTSFIYVRKKLRSCYRESNLNYISSHISSHVLLRESQKAWSITSFLKTLPSPFLPSSLSFKRYFQKDCLCTKIFLFQRKMLDFVYRNPICVRKMQCTYFYFPCLHLLNFRKDRITVLNWYIWRKHMYRYFSILLIRKKSGNNRLPMGSIIFTFKRYPVFN